MGIVVVGAVFVDIKGYPIGTYIPAGRNAGRVVTVHGGVARNLVEDLANVELRPTFVGLVDDTGVGQDVLHKLERHKVVTDFIEAVPDGMGTWLAVFDNNGDVVASISKRPDLGRIERIFLERGEEIFRDAQSVVVEIDMEPAILKSIFNLAGEYKTPVIGVVSNMSIAMERRDLLTSCDCLVCNQQEAGLLFSEDYESLGVQEVQDKLLKDAKNAGFRSMVVTMGPAGAVYAQADGETGSVPAWKVDVIDTTGAGDSFCAGVAMGLTYGKSLREACEIGNRLAASVIATRESTCPRFRPEEFGIVL